MPLLLCLMARMSSQVGEGLGFPEQARAWVGLTCYGGGFPLEFIGCYPVDCDDRRAN